VTKPKRTTVAEVAKLVERMAAAGKADNEALHKLRVDMIAVDNTLEQHLQTLARLEQRIARLERPWWQRWWD